MARLEIVLCVLVTALVTLNQLGADAARTSINKRLTAAAGLPATLRSGTEGGRFNMTRPQTGARTSATKETKLARVEAPACSGSYDTVFIDLGTELHFTTPNYPNNYPSNTLCGWIFTAADDLVLDMYCSYVQLRRGDLIDIWDLVDGTYEYLHDVDRIAFYYYFVGNAAAVGLDSNRRRQADGFECTIWPISLGTTTTTTTTAATTTTTTAGTTTTVDPAAPVTTADPSTSSTDCVCGMEAPMGRIVGGQEAEEYEYPWIVSLGTGSGVFCGGTLISDSWIVTAAHCVHDRTSSLSVGLGYYSRFSSTSDSMRVTVREIIVHPDYDTETQDSDIALLRIDPVDWAAQPAIRPVCLPTDLTKDYDGEMSTIVGWGITDDGSMSTLVNEVDIPIVSNEYCDTVYYITKNMICAARASGGLDSCQGDSGGPMTVLDGANDELVGVVSFGVGCGRVGYPGVYTRVTEFVPWIKQETGSGGYCPRN